VLAIVLAGALVTYGGVSLFVAFFDQLRSWAYADPMA
jgi:H+/gluconate symporter-like permease